MIGTGFPKTPGRAVMNGVHDMGGMDGFGKVEPEPNEPVFHAAWEGRVHGDECAPWARPAHWNIDTSRCYREALPPHVYLASSYYKKWLLGLEDLLVDKGFVGADEIAAGHALAPGKAAEARQVHRRPTSSASWCAASSAGRRPRRRASRRATACARGTSIPRRIRACRAMCAAMSAWSSAMHGCHVFPDSAADRGRARIRNGSTPWCSTRRELWGADADPTVKVSIDAFEPYLEPA